MIKIRDAGLMIIGASIMIFIDGTIPTIVGATLCLAGLIFSLLELYYFDKINKDANVLTGEGGQDE